MYMPTEIAGCLVLLVPYTNSALNFAFWARNCSRFRKFNQYKSIPLWAITIAQIPLYRHPSAILPGITYLPSHRQPFIMAQNAGPARRSTGGSAPRKRPVPHGKTFPDHQERPVTTVYLTLLGEKHIRMLAMHLSQLSPMAKDAATLGKALLNSPGFIDGGNWSNYWAQDRCVQSASQCGTVY
jgi:hypothetical protein